ncbi:MAG: alpha/beta hydrolase [Bacteroidota bacterium]
MPRRFVIDKLPFYAHSIALAYTYVQQSPQEKIDLSPSVQKELMTLGPIFMKDAHIPSQDHLAEQELETRASALLNAIYSELTGAYASLDPVEGLTRMMQYGIYFVAEYGEIVDPGVLPDEGDFAVTDAYVYGSLREIPLPEKEEVGSRGSLFDQEDPPEEATTIEVFYATDRERTGKDEPEDIYGGGRSRRKDPLQGPVEYGICEVSIPPNHKVGEIEAPVWWKLEFTPNPEKHVVLLKVEASPKDAFFQKMRQTVESASRKEAFVFVHGYNVEFHEAAKRSGQMAFDMGFDGAPIMYSWPSRGSTPAYTIDEANIQWTKKHLQDFLQDVSDQSGAETIHLIAHSMGNRALSRAFADLSKEQEEKLGETFKNVILTAPDIDADVFKSEIAPAMLKSKSHITLYASSTDRALQLSKKIHGHPRAGDSGDFLVVLPGMDTIDATNANTELLGHSYFADSVDIISDIVQILSEGTQASKRKGLEKQSNDMGDYWIVPEKS